MLSQSDHHARPHGFNLQITVDHRGLLLAIIIHLLLRHIYFQRRRNNCYIGTYSLQVNFVMCIYIHIYSYLCMACREQSGWCVCCVCCVLWGVWFCLRMCMCACACVCLCVYVCECRIFEILMKITNNYSTFLVCDTYGVLFRNVINIRGICNPR